MIDALSSNLNTLPSKSINSDTNTPVAVTTSLPLDTIVPVLNSAIAQNKNIVSLKFNDEHSLSKTMLSSTEDFIVKSDQNTIQTKWVLINTKEKTVHLILEDEVKANSIVQVNYTQNKNASLQDEFGNVVQSFFQKAINTNEFEGIVADGYIKGAEVTITYPDGSKVTVTTDDNGKFKAPGGGKITASGGVDTSTGQAFTGFLSAPEGSNSINPITTLINAMVEKAVANKIASTDANANVEIDLAQMIAQAESQVASALGINLTLLAESGQSLSDFDPIKTANDPNADPALKAMAVETQAVAVQVNNILTQASSILSSADSTIELASATDAVVQSFISKIEQSNQNASQNPEETNNPNLLQDSNIVKDIMKDSVANALESSTDSNSKNTEKLDALNSVMDKAGEVLGNLNQKLADSASKVADTVKEMPQGEDVDANDLFAEMNAVQKVAQVDAVNTFKEVAKQIQSAGNTDQPIDLTSAFNKVDEFQKQTDSAIQQAIDENKNSSTETQTKPTDTNSETKPSLTETETKPTETITETKPTSSTTTTTTNTGDSTGGGSTGGGSTGGGSTGGGTISDTTAPTITSLTAPTDKTYGLGQKLSFTVNTDENVTVTGTPQLNLTIGAKTKTADYVSGSGSKALVFEYTISTGDDDADGIKINSLDLNNGTLKDSAGNDLILTLGSVDTSKILVDTVAPNAPTLSTTDSDKLINSTEATAGVQIDIDLTSTNAVAGDTVQLKLGSSNLLTAYTLISTDITAKKVSFTVKGADLGSDGQKSITAVITDQAGNISTASSELTFYQFNPDQVTNDGYLVVNAKYANYINIPNNNIYLFSDGNQNDNYSITDTIGNNILILNSNLKITDAYENSSEKVIITNKGKFSIGGNSNIKFLVSEFAGPTASTAIVDFDKIRTVLTYVKSQNIDAISLIARDITDIKNYIPRPLMQIDFAKETNGYTQNIVQTENNTKFTYHLVRSDTDLSPIDLTYRITPNYNGNTTNPDDFDLIASGLTIDPTDPNTLLGKVSFAQGDTTKDIDIIVNNDTIAELDESFQISLITPYAIGYTASSASGTIKNDDPYPIQIGFAKDANGNTQNIIQTEDNTKFVYHLTRTGSDTTTTVELEYRINFNYYRSANKDDFDLTASNLTIDPNYSDSLLGKVSFASGEMSKDITLIVNNDNIAELEEAFGVYLISPANNPTAVDQTANYVQGVITNDDPYPIQIGFASDSRNISQTEDNTKFTYHLTRSGTDFSPIDLTYQVEFLSSTNKDDFDLIASGLIVDPNNPNYFLLGKLSFAQGETSKDITVVVNNDAVAEYDEHFDVNLVAPANNPTVIDRSVWYVSGTIKNDDPYPIQIGFAKDANGNRQDIVQTEDNTTFTYHLTRSGSDTTTAVDLEYRINAYEANKDDFDLISSGLTVDPNNSNYLLGKVSFASGVTSKDITVVVNNDNIPEYDEYFEINLISPASNPTVVDQYANWANGTIKNDDPYPIQIGFAKDANGNRQFLTQTEDQTNFVYHLTRSGTDFSPIDLTYQVEFLWSTNKDDFDLIASGLTVDPTNSSYLLGKISFASGETSKDITVVVNNDNIPEYDENFTIELMSPASNPTAVDQNARYAWGTIKNNDPYPIQIGFAKDANGYEQHISQTEDNTKFTYLLTRTGSDTTTAVDLEYRIYVDSTYLTKDDFNLTVSGLTVDPTNSSYLLGKVSFASGETSKDITVVVNNDSVAEYDENFEIQLIAPANNPTVVNQTANYASGTIKNDDGTPSTNFTEISVDGKGFYNTTETLDASTGAFMFTDNISTGNNVEIKGFGDDDILSIIGATKSQYDFAISSDGSNITLSYNNNGQINTIKLLGLTGFAFDVDSLNASINNNLIFTSGTNQSNNIILGTPNADNLFGTTNSDTIIGGQGADMIDLGIDSTESDVIVINQGDSPATGRDTIKNLLKGDIIDVSSIGIITATPNQTLPTFAGTKGANALLDTYIDITNQRLVIETVDNGSAFNVEEINIGNSAYASWTWTADSSSTVKKLTVGNQPLFSKNDNAGNLTLEGFVIATFGIQLSDSAPAVGGMLVGTNKVNKIDATGLQGGGIQVEFKQGYTPNYNVTVIGSPQEDSIALGNGADMMTGGKSKDSFVFSNTSTGKPTDSNFDTITDWGFNATQDSIDFGNTNLSFVSNATTASAGVAGIATNNIATFDNADNSLALQIIAIEAGLTKSTASSNGGTAPIAGHFAIWTNNTDSYLFISDNIAGVSDTDVLIKLTGISSLSTISITSGDITEIA